MPAIPPNYLSSLDDKLQEELRSIPQSESPERARQWRSENILESLSPPRPLLPRSDHDPSLDSNTNTFARRQTYISNLPATYRYINDGPSSGTVVGIVLGVVLGYILIFWLIVALINARPNPAYVEGDETEIVVRRSSGRSKRSHRSRRTRTEAVSEVSEVPLSQRRSPRREESRAERGPRTERIIVKETVRRSETSRPPPRPVSPISEHHESINISVRDDARVDGDDMVEVIEEESSESTPDPAPRRKKGGYRTVDPNAYAGGNYPRQDYDGRSRSRR